MDLNEILTIAIKVKASDVHIKGGLPPVVRVDGKLRPIPGAPRIMPDAMRIMAYGIMNDRQKKQFEEQFEADLAYSLPGLARFRVNVYSQRGTVAMVCRAISFTIPNLDDLGLPAVLKKISMEERGLILVTGTTGCGKSTTLAAMVDHINSNRTCNIITIEDPVEYLHRDKRSIVSQRELGVDTTSFARALTSALRQDPDVILVGEMRDHETIETAINAAETGHLVLSTLHTMDATESINRIIAVFPPYQQRQIRLQLSAVIKGVVSQRLVSRADGKGRIPAVEVMVSTARVRECIDDKEKTKQIHEAITQGYVTYGMQSFDQSLMQLYTNKLISYEEALRQSSNPDDFALKVSGISATSNASWDQFEQQDQKPADAPEIEKF